MSVAANLAGVDPEESNQNTIKNNQILGQCKSLLKKIEEISDKLKIRLESSIQCQFELNQNKIDTFDQIDKFFEQLHAKVEKRREALKTQYSSIESREKRRLKIKQIKLQKELDLLDEYRKDFDDYIEDFDLEMDHMANEANFENEYKQQY